MTFSVWISFALLTALQTASPGPAVSLLISTGLRSGIAATLALIPGIFLGDLTLIAVAFALTTALFSVSEAVFDGIRIIGGAYLLFLGIKTIVGVRSALTENEKAEESRKTFNQGFFTSILNPKGLLYFATFLPQFISPEGSYDFQFAVLGATFLVVGLINDTFYAVTSSYGSRYLTLPIRGGLIVVAGTSLLLTGAYVFLKYFEIL
ncbi:LysE family translocator [Ciceribacter ferrooxidans]|uniref:LysE family translocator n=1 Tax=Ciceribacter ferrooxidans TaxID=2509717 RepID=A0A4Q2T2B6_9HYPH|nr:LysE family translocator [Ciceribacter ferrooxidans]RYC12043.1 LysE family translocator [Ciceribacter ferrooxidans]